MENVWYIIDKKYKKSVFPLVIYSPQTIANV